MKKTVLFLAMALTVSLASAQRVMSSFNEKGYGVVSGRIQYLGMYRNYDNVKNGNASTLGGILGYLTPTWAGLDAGLAYNYAGTTFVAGRKISNGEVFLADDFRQKSRSIQAVQIETRAIPNTALTVGHANKLSNWIDSGTRWEFNDIGNVFGVGYHTDGIT
jgi:hypothetical protein